MDLTELEDIKNRWLEYTEELYNKDLYDPDSHDGVVTHLEPDILECKVKWALGNIPTNKASESDRIPAELFQILKDDAVKVLHSICQQIWKTQQWPQDWKSSVFIPIPKKDNNKEYPNYCTVELILHASKVIPQAMFQQYINQELPDVPAVLRKGRGTRDQIANFSWLHRKSKWAPKTHLLLLYWLCQNLWLCESQNLCKILQEVGIGASWEIFILLKKQQLELDMQQ